MSLARKGVEVVSVNWLVLPLYLITSIIIVRWLGVEGRGIVVVLSSTAAFLGGIGHLGVPAAGIYYARNGGIGERTLFVHFLALVVIFTCACLAAMVFWKDSFAMAFLDGVNVSFEWMFVTLITVPLLMLNNYLATILLAQGRAREYAGMQMGIGILGLAGTLILVVWLGLGITGALYAGLLAQGVPCLAMSLGMLLATRGQPAAITVGTIKQLLFFGMKHYVGTVGSQVFKRANNFLLAFFLDTTAVGYYSVAMIPYEASLSIPRGVNALLSGDASSQAPRDAAISVARSFRNILWVMLITAVGLALVCPFVVPAIYGKDFVQSIPALMVLLVVSVLIGCAMNLQAYFLGTGRPGINGVLTLAAGLINVALAVFLIPAWGIEGSAVAALLAWMVGLCLHVVCFVRSSKMSLVTMCIPTREDIAGWKRLTGRIVQAVKKYFGGQVDNSRLNQI